MSKKLLVGLLIGFIALLSGCGGTKAPTASHESSAAAVTGGHISVLSLRGDTGNMTQDQIIELKRVGTWMDRDIIKQLKRAGYTPKLLSSRKEFNGSRLFTHH